MNEVLERAIRGVVEAAQDENWEEVTMRLPQLIAVTDFPEHHYETPAMEGLVEVLRQMVAVFPPDDWEHFDSWGDYEGYGEHGDRDYVESVDQSNSGDVHSHGISVGGWFFAKDVRKLLTGLKGPQDVYRHGPADIIGRWPGTESDEEVNDALERLS